MYDVCIYMRMVVGEALAGSTGQMNGARAPGMAAAVGTGGAGGGAGGWQVQTCVATLRRAVKMQTSTEGHEW